MRDAPTTSPLSPVRAISIQKAEWRRPTLIKLPALAAEKPGSGADLGAFS
jgi:hypothetical protein